MRGPIVLVLVVVLVLEMIGVMWSRLLPTGAKGSFVPEELVGLYPKG
jgi:hypothetical protein